MIKQAFAGHLPIVGSDIALQWDNLYYFLIWLSLIFFIIVVGGMIYFAIAYRKREGAKTKYITGHHLLEGIWIFVPTVLLMVIFIWGYIVYHRMVQPPSDALEIKVVGKQWTWTFQYEDGRITVGKVYVPIYKPVKLVMSSEDVLHSFFIPNFRVKQDVVPGMYTSVWFNANEPGRHQVYCAEYCGAEHSGMLADVIVLNDAQYEEWMKGKEPAEQIPVAGFVSQIKDTQDKRRVQSALNSGDLIVGVKKVGLADQGQRLIQTRGCVACHSLDGAKKIGPTLKGLFEHEVQLDSGQKVKADVNYLRESIENPNAKIVKGYLPSMPTFQGTMSDTELNAVIAYIKSIR